jgi:hypothetical protein
MDYRSVCCSSVGSHSAEIRGHETARVKLIEKGQYVLRLQHPNLELSVWNHVPHRFGNLFPWKAKIADQVRCLRKYDRGRRRPEETFQGSLSRILDRCIPHLWRVTIGRLLKKPLCARELQRVSPLCTHFGREEGKLLGGSPNNSWKANCVKQNSAWIPRPSPWTGPGIDYSH